MGGSKVHAKFTSDSKSYESCEVGAYWLGRGEEAAGAVRGGGHGVGGGGGGGGGQRNRPEYDVKLLTQPHNHAKTTWRNAL